MGFLVAVGLAIFAFTQQQIAEEQRLVAEDQRELAQMREQEAEQAAEAEGIARKEAEQQKRFAISQRQIAEDQRKLAQERQREAEQAEEAERKASEEAQRQAKRVKAGAILTMAASKATTNPTLGTLLVTELRSFEEPFDGVRKARNFLRLPHCQGIMQNPDGLRSRMTRAAISPDGTRVWRVGWKELLTYLRSTTSACLTVPQRRQYLAEEPDDATAKYEACERQYGRTP